MPQPFRTPIREWEDLGSDRVRLSTLARDQDPTNPSMYALDVDVWRNGSAELTSAGVIWRLPPHAENVILEPAIAGTVASFLALVGALYELAGYHGHLDIGVAVEGLQGAVSSTEHPGSFPQRRYNANEYRRVERFSAGELAARPDVVRRLLHHLFESTTGHVDTEPFTWAPG